MSYTKKGYCCGESNQNAKLSESQVREARQLYHAGSHANGATALARRFGISQASMRDALFRITWKHVQ